MHTIARFVSLTAFATILAGCGGSGDGLPREPISGKVSLNGQPIEKGMITFVLKNAPEPVVTALIEKGEFQLPRAEGPIAGSHGVSIWAKGPTGKTVKNPDDPEQTVPEMKDLVPPQYNLNSTLTADVKTSDANTFTFDLVASKVAQKPGKSRR